MPIFGNDRDGKKVALLLLLLLLLWFSLIVVFTDDSRVKLTQRVFRRVSLLQNQRCVAFILMVLVLILMMTDDFHRHDEMHQGILSGIFGKLTPLRRITVVVVVVTATMMSVVGMMIMIIVFVVFS